MDNEKRLGMAKKGWMDIWGNSEDIINETRKQYVLPLRDINPDDYDGVNLEITREDSGMGDERRISLIPSSSELATAPKAVRRVLKDIGVNFDDEVTVALTIPRHSSLFGLRIVPTIIDKDHVGIEIANHRSAEKLIEMRTTPGISSWGGQTDEEDIIVEMPLFRSERDYDNLKSTNGTQRAQSVGLAYRGFSGNFDGNELFGKASPYVSKILIKGAKWVNSMVEARKIPVQTLVEQPATV